MENRFGFKEFVLCLFLTAIIVVILLAMKQYDRQFEVLQQISRKLDDQMDELTSMNRNLNHLGQGGFTEPATTEPTTVPAADDPFRYIREAQATPGYAQGDWLVESFLTGTDKLTPLVSSDEYAATVQAYVVETLLTRDEGTLDWVPLLAQSVPPIQDNTAAYQKYFDQRKAAGLTDADLARDPDLPKDPASDAYKKYVADRKKSGVMQEDIDRDPDAPIAATITYQLRPNVVFSDGVPMTAEDVAWTYALTMNPDVDDPRDRGLMQTILKDVKAEGNDRVTFTFRRPYFDSYGLSGGLFVLPKHFYSKYSVADFNKSTGLLLGSGPYKMQDPTSWTPGNPIILVRNDRYWGVQPAFDRIVYKIITDQLAELTAFRNRDIDDFSAQPDQYRDLLKDTALVERTQNFKYYMATSGYRYIGWNEERDGKPTVFADKRVRTAMTMMTNRQGICDQILYGYAKPVTGPFYPDATQNDPTVKPIPYDVAGARDLLLQAGFKDNGNGGLNKPDGSPFTVELTYPNGISNYEQMGLFLKDSYAQAGVQLTLDALDWPSFSDKLKKRDFDAITLAWSAGIESDIFQMFDSSQIANDGDDFISYRNPTLDKIIEQARQTVDESKRMPLWQEAHRILADEQPYTFLFTRQQMDFFDKRLHNIHPMKIGLDGNYDWFVPASQQKWGK